MNLTAEIFLYSDTSDTAACLMLYAMLGLTWIFDVTGTPLGTV